MQKTMSLLYRSAGKRLSAKAYLEQWGPKLFPGYFSTFLHPFFTALRPMDADERVAAVLAAYPQLLLAMQPRQPSSPARSLGVACTSAYLVAGCTFGLSPCHAKVISSGP